MEESFGAQYALQVALQTLRERCQQFQHRVLTLEEENLNLRSKIDLSRSVRECSLSDVDALKQQVAQLTEQKDQLTNTIQMVSTENKRLWSRLSKLTQVNENLGLKLHKINDKLTHINPSISHSPHIATTLIRSRTFTQEEPHKKVYQKNVTDENEKISLELEDISLKLLSTIAQEKCELELQCSQMTEMQNSDVVFINSLAFPVEDIEDAMPEEFEEHLRNLKNIKHLIIQEREKVQKNMLNLNAIKCERNYAKPKVDKLKKVSISVQTEGKAFSIDEPETNPNYNKMSESATNKAFVSKEGGDKICPMCSKIFHKDCMFIDFQNHVESHFIEDNFEVIS